MDKYIAEIIREGRSVNNCPYYVCELFSTKDFTIKAGQRIRTGKHEFPIIGTPIKHVVFKGSKLFNTLNIAKEKGYLPIHVEGDFIRIESTTGFIPKDNKGQRLISTKRGEDGKLHKTVIKMASITLFIDSDHIDSKDKIIERTKNKYQ